MGLFDDLLLEEEKIQTPRRGLFDDLLEEEEEEVGTLQGISNAAMNAFDSSRQAIAVVGGVTPEEAQDISKIEYNKSARKLAPGYAEYQEAEGWDAVGAFLKNPIEVTSNIIAEGLAGSLPALGAGLASGGVGAAAGSVLPGVGTGIGFTTGQVAGTFAGSLATEYGGKILEELQEAGMDINDPQSIQTFFGNETLLGEAREKALKRGVPVAAFDALSAGIGGKLGRVFGTKVLTEGEKIIGKQFATKTGEALTELGVQAGLGGGGEVAGSLVAGEPIEGKAVFGEVIGEAGPGSVEVITGRIADRNARLKVQEGEKIKQAADLATNLEENNAPLTARVVQAKAASNIEQDKLAAELENLLDEEELTSELQTTFTPLTPEEPVTPVTQPTPTDATQEIIQPEGVRQEPQDGVEVRPTEEAGVSRGVFDTTRGQEEGQVDPVLFGLQSVANNTATREQILTLSGAGLVDVIKGKPVINEDGEAFLASQSAPLPSLTPEERIAEIEAEAPVAPTEVPTEPIIGEIPQTSPMIGEQPAEPTISEILPTSDLIGAEPTQPIISEKPATSELVSAEPIAVVEQEQVATAEAPAITPTPVAETPAVAPAPEVAPAQESGINEVLRKAENAATRDEAAQIGSDFAELDPSIPPPPSVEYEIVKAISNKASRRGYNADVLTEENIKSAKESGLLTKTKIPKLTEAGRNLVTDGDRAAKERENIIGDITDKIIDQTVSAWDAKNNPASASFKERIAAQPSPVAETPAPVEAPSTPSSISVGSRVKGKGPQTYIVEEVLTPSQREVELGEQYYRIRNERTGEVGTFESKDIKPVKAKGVRKMATTTNLSDSLDSGEFNAAQAFVDEGATMDRETFIRSITPSATQRATTIHTRLEKDGIISKEEFSNGKGLVYGDGRGAASSYLGGQSYEPFPPAGFTPDYTGDRVAGKGDAIGEKFSTILNTFVLNVVDPQTRSFIVKDIANLLQNGGRAVFVTRGSDVGNSKALVSFAPLERIQKSEGKLTYQKGFTQKELIQYLQETLGDGFTVKGLRGGTASDVRVEVIKNTDAELNNPPITPDIRREVATRVKDESLIVPEKDRYTFEEVQAEANKLFGGIPEGFVIVSDTTNPDYEFKAGYDIDNGNIIVNLAYIKKGESVRNLIAHELGHYAAGDPAIRAQLQAFLDGLPAEQKAKLERFVDRVYNKDTGEVRLEEKAVRAFVVMLKKGDNRNVFQKLLDTIKRWLNEKLGTKFQMTDMDAAAVLSGAVDRFRSGEKIAREEGASGNRFNETNFSRFPGEAVSRTSATKLTSHPLYNAAKKFENVKAAQKLVDDLVDDQMVLDVFKNIDETKPAYIVPVIKPEGDSLNMLPVALANKLSEASGIPVWGELAQVTSGQSTGAGVNDKSEITRHFVGTPPPEGAQIIIVDDYLATGRTIASLENITGKADAIATIAFGRYGKEYGLSTSRADEMLEKANITRERFYEIYGLQPEQAITGTEAQSYILNGAAGETGFTKKFPVEEISPSNERIKNISNVPESIILFSGGGLFELGIRGIAKPGYAVEANQRIAEFYEEAHGVPVIQEYVQNVRFYGIQGGHLHASPVCKNFSTAKNKQQVTEQDKIIDREAAGAVAQAITDIQPNTVSIENVIGYKDTESYNTIISALEENGYIYDANIYNASDYGSPTSRRRLIVRAVKKGGVLPEVKKKKQSKSWYESVKDIVNDLPDHDIYKARYPARMMANLEAKGIDIYNVSEPLLISGTDGKTFRNADQPAMTFLASPKSLNIIALPGGIIKKVTARAMARMSGVPDSFPLPEDEALAKTIVGNGIPPAMTRSVVGSLISANTKPQKTSPDIRRAAAEPRREQVGGAEREEAKPITTPPGIMAKATGVIRQRFFDGTTVSKENTTKAWNYISQLLDIKSRNANRLAGEINDVVDADLLAQQEAAIAAGEDVAPDSDPQKRIGAAMFSVELMNYAGRLAAEGDPKMLKFLIRNINDMPVDEFAGGISEDARALVTRKAYDVPAFKALEIEQGGKVNKTAGVLFGTTKPTDEEVKATDDALKESDNVQVSDIENLQGEIENVEKRTKRNVSKKIDEKIKESTKPKKDELLLSFENLNADKKIKGIQLIYKPQKVNVSKNIKDFIIGKLVDYRKMLINQGASGLESTFWQTMSDQERKPGPLGEIDQAQNNELAKIVRSTLVKLGLEGEPPNTKMTEIEKVASILNKHKLSEEKRLEADKRIIEEIERRRQSELEAGFTPEAVNAKYDAITGAWNQSMSRQLNMPISDNTLQRLISAEMKELKTNLNELTDEPDGRVLAVKKKNIVDSILRKIYGVSKEYETGIEMDENYDGLKGYLEQTLNNMYASRMEDKNAAYAKRQAKISLRGGAEVQAQSIINQLAGELSDTPAFPQKQENQIKSIVKQDLSQNPNMGRKQPWTSQLTGRLMQAGASEAQAQTIADLVWRQHEIKAMDREIKEIQTAAEKGSLAVIVQRIKDTPLSEQQDPEWKKNVIKDYLREAGLSVKAAETAARLYDSILNEKLAEAKQKAFEDALKKQAPWNNYFSRNGRLAKNALETIKTAIRTGVLDPEQNTESIIAGQQGYKGFTKEQFQRMVQLEEIISNPSNDDLTRREAVDELNKIIAQVKIPVRIRDAIAAYYSAQALMGIPTATVNIASPVGFAIRNVITDVARYTFTGPQNIPVAFESFLNSMRNWYDHVSYAFRNQIYSNDVVEYLQGQNVLRELFDQGKRKWAKGQYASGMADMLVGMTQITGRVLSSLDQGAIAMMESQNIPRYALDAMANNNKIPKDKRKEVADLILNGRRKIKEDLVASGMKADRAGVLADLQVRSEMIAALSGFGISGQKVLDASINDALQTVGRNRVLTVDGVKQERNNLRDEGFLASLPIGFLERIAADAGAGSQAQQIFAKMLYGFALVPARVFSTAAWFSPYGFVRLGIDAISKKQGYKSRYAMSLATDLQYKQRLTEAIAGSVVMLGLAAVTANSTDDDEEDDRPFKIVVTGNGPDYNTDRQYYDSWHKKWKPYSIHIVMGDTIIPINIGRGGEALFFPVLLAGALDDWKIKEKLNQARKDPKDLEMAAELLGSTFFALAQRGPYASFSQPLFDASKEGKIVPELFGQAGYFGKTFIPILGSSLARNVSDFLNAPVDRSSVQGAIWANTPVVGPWMGTQALNGLGQPMRADDFGDKLFKLGVPVVFSFPKNTPMNELNELILKKGGGPTIPTRTNAQRKFDEPLTDKEFEIYVREYGRVMSDMMFRNRRLLEASNPEQYNKTLDKYANGYGDVRGAKDFAVEAVRRLRRSQK